MTPMERSGLPHTPSPTQTPTLREVLRACEARLKEAGVESPGLDARLLVQHALGMRREDLLIQALKRLTPAMVERVLGFVERRAAREPVSRILGRREFWSLEFVLDASTLDPRPDTETLVEAALALVADRNAALSVLDLGTGTGCILLALLAELPRARGVGIDVQEAAVATAAAKARRLGFAPRADFRRGDWAAGLEERFDLVLSNPPYIPDGEIAALAPEVAVHDPRAALAGGPDGLDAYRRLAPQVAAVSKPGGRFVFEVGAGQVPAVTEICAASGLVVDGIRHDLAGVERCVFGRAAL